MYGFSLSLNMNFTWKVNNAHNITGNSESAFIHKTLGTPTLSKKLIWKCCSKLMTNRNVFVNVTRVI